MWPLTHGRHPTESQALVLAVLSDPADRSLVTGLAPDDRCSIEVSESIEKGRSGSAGKPIAVVLLDRDLALPDWRPLVREFSSLPSAPCVILASAVFDDYLFQELTHQGGYDVITKPLKLEELRRISRLALTFWKNRRPSSCFT